MATGDKGHVEVHVLDRNRWEEAARTPSFDVSYEVLGSNAPVADCIAIRDAITNAIRANDPGALHVQDIARHMEMPSLVERVLDRLRDRSFFTGAVLVAVGVVLTQDWLGALILASLLAVTGFWLRAVHLDGPFLTGGEVQRFLEAELPLKELIRSVLFNERHPPLLFFVLHAIRDWNHSEMMGRMPAVVAGSLIGPAILLAACWVRRNPPSAPSSLASVPAVCAALVASFSPVLVLRSRELSELTTFGLLAVVAVTATLRSCEQASRGSLWLLAIGHALLFWTYYLAGFLLIGFWLMLRLTGPLPRRVIRAAALGSVAGLPSLAFAALSLVHDYPTRQKARLFSQFLWGERTVAEVGREVFDIVANTFGMPLLVVGVLIAVVAVARKDRAVLSPIAASAAVAGGMLVLVSPARIQPYYFVSALPLLLLALALFEPPNSTVTRWAVPGLLALATASAVPRLLAREADLIYAGDGAEYGRRFAPQIQARAESRVALGSLSDITVVAFGIARHVGVPINWHSFHPEDGAIVVNGLRQRFIALGPDVVRPPQETLDTLAKVGSFLAVTENPSPFPAVNSWMEHCTELDHTVVRRLLLCPGEQ
ncbi:MAG: hypothetical protein HY270_16730 [Deltaproteobacteria bacterium]|nr:hypothetical protein [Deltaproteobacteria bacterium]